MARTPSEDGFTLLETLVALTAFAAITIALQQSHIAGLRAARIAYDEMAALDIARSLLASAGTLEPLRSDLDTSGNDGRYRWHLTAQKYAAPEQVPELPPQMEGYWTTITVTWPARPATDRSVQLRTLKLQATSP